ncbi:terminase large subunit domain-containing protein [Brevundimonas sp.]|uniref:terminase large subunit domain-containing protein n=1 Tax=Brevundimonas sp. TaxID=1871086 RepID=UPI002D4A2980|nr:terminase family protein [Brevundimonas sp.]HYD27283.1 terminase family protein [Brevundimonas sp.]
MAKSKLTDPEWLALFAEELAGVPRRVLTVKYGVSKSAINVQALKRGLRKRDTGAFDHRCIPPGGWPEHEPLRQNRHDMTPADWRAAARRRLDGECDRVIAADWKVSTGALNNQAAGFHMRKRDVPGAVYRSHARRDTAAPDPWDGDDDVPAAPLELRESQQPPRGAWSTWLFLGGRGAGKTLAGASWLADQAEALGPGGRLALIGPTLHDVREVMIEGVSGVRSLPRWTRATRPKFQSSRRRLVFENGCQAWAFSAEDPDSLRGPQFSAAWADEFCAWRGSGPRGAAETLALLRMGLRLPLRPSTPSGSPSPSQGDGEETEAPTVSSPLRGEGDPEGGEGATHPRLVVTTTPRPTRALVRLRDEAGCALTHAPTAENADHLSPGFLDNLHALYGGTRRAAQELDGQIVELDGALFTAEMMARARQPLPSPLAGGERFGGAGPTTGGPEGRMRGLPDPSAASSDSSARRRDPSSVSLREPPSPARGEGTRYDRTIVAIDPTASAGGAACGLIAAASYRRPDGTRCAVVLADRSIAGLGPDAWARRAVALAEEFAATAIVAEVNQGGDMVRAVLKTAGARLRIREVHATRGKYIRAEPVAALYEQGRIHHAGPFDALEEELMAFGGQMEAAGSLDRADALVWAITDLLVDAPEGERGPRVRWV